MEHRSPSHQTSSHFHGLQGNFTVDQVIWPGDVAIKAIGAVSDLEGNEAREC